MPQPRRVARKNGFQPPMSKNQRTAWCTQGSSTLFFFGVVIVILNKPDAGTLDSTIWPLFIVQIAAVVCGASLWLFLECHDPSEPSCWGMWLPTSDRWTKVRYCAIHRTKIIGLDHHCTWLNTTVGRYNYVPFFLLVIFGVIQFWVQIVIGLIILIGHRDDMNTKFNGNWTAIEVVLVIHELGVFCVASCYTLLLTFHLYLFYLDQNTYDFLLNRSKRLKEKKKQQQGSRTVSNSNSISSSSAAGGSAEAPSAITDSSSLPPDIELGEAGMVPANNASTDSETMNLDDVKDVERISDGDRDASDLHLLSHDGVSPR